LLCQTLARLHAKPRALISASAVGYYGDRGQQVCDETTAAGTGFLAEVCQQWEQATQPAAEAGIRVVQLRIGVVGRLGSGRQYMSWIVLEELAQVVLYCAGQTELRGPVNAVAPGAVTNLEFTKALGRVLSRPTILPLPAPIARIALGEMADALLLASTRVAPRALSAHGYEFQFPSIDAALRYVIENKA
jgi:NAD dependent epimerase/dehydratase family enzyme